MSLKICFVLPRYSRTPIGGFKIIFEYANRLLAYDNEVSIAFLNNNALCNSYIPMQLKKVLVEVLTRIEPKWFPLDKRIKKISYYNRNIQLDNYDICIATAVETAQPVKELFSAKNKFYLIQGFEDWNVSQKYVIETFNSGLINIVVSTWLKEIVDKYSDNKSILIKNPLDLNIYKINVPIEKRKSHTIGLLYHEAECKGLKYSFEVLKKLKILYPELEVKMFGASNKPKGLPDWIHYTCNASTDETVEIYNSVSVFICSSIEEGFGLTGMEAMACGAALVSSRYRGVLEYAEHNYNAKLSEVKNVDVMVANVCELFENNEERIRIATNGVNSLKDNGWEQAVEKLNKVLIGEINNE